MGKVQMAVPGPAGKLMFRGFFILAVTALFAAMAISLFSGIANAGPAVILFWIFLGIAFRGNKTLKGYTYSAMIFASFIILF